MWNWEKAFSYCSSFCQKSSQIPQNTELGYVLYWWLKREHHQVNLPRLCSALCFIASPSIDDHWRCARCLRPEQHCLECHGGSCPATALLTNMPSLGLVANCKFPASGEVHFSMVLVSCSSLNLLQAAPVTGMMRITGVFWAVPLLASEKSEGGAWEGSGTWRSLLHPRWHLPAILKLGSVLHFAAKPQLPAPKLAPPLEHWPLFRVWCLGRVQSAIFSADLQ